MRKFKKGFIASLAFSMLLSVMTITPVQAAGGIEVTQKGNSVVIGNEYITREFSTENNKLTTEVITNNRTGETPTLLVPESGSEEFIIALLPNEFPSISRNGWTAIADSYQTNDVDGDGPASNLIDGSASTIWHSRYNNQGVAGDQVYPHNVIFNFAKEETFKAFTYTARGGSTNGRINQYRLYANSTTEKLDFNSAESKWQLISEGTFNYGSGESVTVNLDKAYTATQLKLVAVNEVEGRSFASGAEFKIHADFYNPSSATIKASELELDGQPVVETINKDGKTGKALKFNFKTKQYEGVDYTISEVITMYDGDSFMRKHLEISVPENQAANAKISYIDLENMNFAAADLKEDEFWTIPEQANNSDMANMKGDFLELGQPYYIGAMYFGSEFPQTENKIKDGNGYIRYWYGKSLAKDPHFEYNKNNTAGFMETWDAVVGAARSRDYLVCQADFYEYIETIATPTDFRQQYNSWYDLMKNISATNIQDSFYEIEKGFTQYGVNPLDSYVVDDGWINYNSFWAFNNKFPNELYDAALQVQQLGSDFGLWLGPRGGYGTEQTISKWIADNGYGSRNPQSNNDINISDSRYLNKLLSDIFLSYQDKFDINYWKLDGMLLHPATAESEYYVTGNPFYTISETYERWTDMFEDMRTQEGVSEELWINLTSYLNPSPWYLQWVNSVWMQNTGDTGYTQKYNSTDAEQTLTYRDGAYYNFIFERQWQLPNKYFYNHDPVYGLTAHNSYKPNQISFTTDEMRDYLFMLGTRGTAFWEYYYSYSMFDDDKWQVNAEAANWIEDNFHILQKSKMFSAGNPRDGKVYGYSCWNGEDGIVSIRNPLDSAQTYTLTYDRLVGVTEGIKDVKGKVVVGDLKWQTEDLKVSYGDVVTFELEPKEVLIIQYGETDTTAPAIDSIHGNGNTLEITFDENIREPEAANISVEGNTVTDVTLKADRKTALVTLENRLTPGSQINVTVNNILDIVGNAGNDTHSDDYYKDDIVLVYEGGEFNGTSLSAESNASIDGHGDFTVAGKVNTTSKNAVLVAQEGAYTVSIDEEGYLEFTFNGMTANSKYTEKLINNGQVEATVKGLVADGNEHTFVAVKEVNGMIKLYVDGKLVKSAYDETKVNPEVNKGNILLGEGLNGTLSNVAIFDRGVAFDEVETLVDDLLLVEGTKVELTEDMLSASSIDTKENINKGLANLLDGNNTTFWATHPDKENSLNTTWLQVDLGEVKYINKVELSTRYNEGNGYNCTGNIYDFTVTVSKDGIVWEEVETGDIVNGTGMIHFKPVEARYIKITSSSSYHWDSDLKDTVMCIADINIYEIDTRVEINPENMTATPTSTNEGNINNIFDNDPTTFWASVPVSKIEKGNPNVVVDLGDDYIIDQVDYTKRYFNGADNQWKCTGNIRKYVIDVSTDNENWTTVSTGETFADEHYTTKGDGGTTNIKFSPIKAKYVRISATESYHWKEAELNTVLTIGDLAIHGEKFSNYEITNLAEGIVPTAKWSATNESCPVNKDWPLSNATDKGIGLGNYVDFGQDNNANGSYIELDLGSDSYIDRIKLYRYWQNNRVYRNTVIAVSDDPHFSNPTIIFNSDKDNVHGFGVGEDTAYPESSNGTEFVLDKYVTARYVRVYMNGQSDSATTNHIVELQVFGFDYQDTYIYDDVVYKSKDDSQTGEYLFESYYKDGEGSKVATKDEFTNKQNEYFAKYVTPKVLTVKGQAKNNGDGTFTIRFVSSVPSLNLENVGFEVQKNNGAVKEITSTTVYTQIAETESGQTLFTNPANIFKTTESKYFFIVKIKGITAEHLNDTITVTPYWTPLGSNTKIKGVSRTEKIGTFTQSAPSTINQ